VVVGRAPCSYEERQYRVCLGVGVGRVPHGLDWWCPAAGPGPPPPPTPDAKSERIHKDSFSALTLSAFVCKNVAF
jgi:hypothetical protein